MNVYARKKLAILLDDIDNIYWKNRILNSIRSLELLICQEIRGSDIKRESIDPNKLRVVALDELNVLDARKYLKETKCAPPPITAIYYQDAYYLFMGSIRAIEFVLLGKLIDSISVTFNEDIPNKPIYILNAQFTLLEYLKKKNQSI
jgi:hypothetical protein